MNTADLKGQHKEGVPVLSFLVIESRVRAVLTLHGKRSDYTAEQLVRAGPRGADCVGQTKL